MATKYFLFVLTFLLLFSCKTKESILITYDMTADGWLNRPSNEEFPFTMNPIDIQIVFLLKEKLEEAVIELSDVFYTKLTDDRYEYFTGQKKEINTSAYLIRSINYSFNETGYSIYKNEKDDFLIFHGVLSRGKWRGLQKWPIIILYDGIINEVFTSYSVNR